MEAGPHRVQEEGFSCCAPHRTVRTTAATGLSSQEWVTRQRTTWRRSECSRENSLVRSEQARIIFEPAFSDI